MIETLRIQAMLQKSTAEILAQANWSSPCPTVYFISSKKVLA
jgi:hypothetical protein